MIAFLDRMRQRLAHFGNLWHLKRAITFLLVDVILLAFVPRRKADVVMLIRVDLLGDYVIGRNFLRQVRRCERYRGKKLVLCASLALRELIELYDSDTFDGYVWIDRPALLNRFWPRFRMLREVKRTGAQVVIHPMRDPYLGDCLVRASCAAERIGIESRENPNRTPNELRRQHTTLGDLFYTQLVPETHEVTFEFYRNRAFFEAVLPGVVMPGNTRMKAVAVSVPEIGGPFAVLMPGASDAFREWPPERLAQVARHLFETRGLQAVMIGTAGDRPKAEALRRAAPGVPAHNLCGELGLPQVVYLLSQAAIGITNDSGGIHVLAALGRPGVAVSNTFSFGWFHPYPRELSRTVSHVYPPAVYATPMTWDEARNFYGRRRDLFAITDVSVDAVIARADALLDGRPYDDAMEALCVAPPEAAAVFGR